jgi:hypothetical protein
MEGVKSEKRGNFSREQLRKKKVRWEYIAAERRCWRPQARVARKKTAKVFW